MTNVYVDPTASEDGDGSEAQPFNSWASVSFEAGDYYLQRAGTTASATLHVTTTSVTIGAYGSGAAPVLEGGIDLDGATNVTVQGLDIENPNGPAIALENGANSITIIDNSLINSRMGIWIGNNAGGGNLIANNAITGNATHGIGIAQIAAGSRIVGNNVSNNAWYGIDIDGDGFTVSGNAVDGNGLTIPGTSGIHVYGGAPGAPDGFGVGNAITGNMTDGNHDSEGLDGNGIELDQYTHGNVVIGNESENNDGAGIVLFDSYENDVIGNLLAFNEQDPGHSHTVMGQLALNESDGDTYSNYIAANAGISTQSSPAVFIDGVSVNEDNEFAANIWESPTGGSSTQIGVDTSWAHWLLFAPTDHDGGLSPIAPYTAGTPDFTSSWQAYGSFLPHGFAQ